MIVLDTNVLSELLRPRPSAQVERWIRDEEMSALFTTTVTQAEMLLGLELLPGGRRREMLMGAISEMFDVKFAGRLLSFDAGAARALAPLAAGRRRAGRPISLQDAQIAAIARSHDASLATRNTADFEGCGVDLIDPWTPA